VNQPCCFLLFTGALSANRLTIVQRRYGIAGFRSRTTRTNIPRFVAIDVRARRRGGMCRLVAPFSSASSSELPAGMITVATRCRVVRTSIAA